MSPPPRQLTFAVSTSLLTASLVTGVACDKRSHPVNVHPDAEPHVNEGPEQPEETVNEGPVEEPADDPDEIVNAPQEPESEPEPEPEPGPNVNVVAPD